MMTKVPKRYIRIDLMVRRWNISKVCVVCIGMEHKRPVHVVAISGSLRRSSSNSALIAARRQWPFSKKATRDRSAV